jgi:hypothetical protein
MKTNLSIDFPTLMTTIYVLVDEWGRQNPDPNLPRVGVRPRFSESEMITLALMMDYLPFPGETQFLAFMRGNYREWFPNLPHQSQFNRRLRRLDGRIEHLRRTWVVELGATEEKNFLIDTKPLPVLGLKREKKRSDFAGNAAPGWCAARMMRYFGYKLVMLATADKTVLEATSKTF